MKEQEPSYDECKMTTSRMMVLMVLRRSVLLVSWNLARIKKVHAKNRMHFRGLARCLPRATLHFKRLFYTQSGFCQGLTAAGAGGVPANRNRLQGHQQLWMSYTKHNSRRYSTSLVGAISVTS